MKILVVNDILQGGGVEKLMYDFVTYFCEKYEITILTDVMDSDFDKIYPSNVSYLYQMEKEYEKPNNIFKKKLIERVRKRRENKLKMQIKDMNFDVLLCFKESWIMMMALTYGDYIKKKFAWVHTDYSKSYYTKVWFGSEQNEVNYMKRFDNVICVSEVILNSIKMVIGDPGNLMVCYNPVNKEDILKKSLEEVTDIQKDDRLLFVTVGRLNIQKGYDILLEVCNLLNKQGLKDKYAIWLIGGGESFNNYQVLHDLERQINKYNLTNVYLLGERKNPYKYMRQADWFLSTSRYEGYSYVSQEATIVGAPLILSDCSGVLELLKDESNGIIMENSFAGIYLGMKQAIENKELCKQYKGKVVPKSKEEYWDNQLHMMEKLFL